MRRLLFHALRVVLWTVQIPLALGTDLKNSTPYLVFLSLAALVESSGTDLDQAWQARREGKRKLTDLKETP